MAVGYLPDMFGHVAQMPQLLALGRVRARGGVARRAGRGRRRPRSGGRRPTGRGCGPSTCTARTRTAATCPTTRRRWWPAVHGYELELGPARLAGGDVLLMNGTDHQMPQPWLGRVVAEANAVQDDYRFVVTSLPEYLAAPADRGARHLGGRAALGGAGERADGGGVEPGRRAPGRGPGRAGAGAARRAALGAAAGPRGLPGGAARRGLAPAGAEQRARLVVRVQPRRGGRRGAWSATRRPARSATRWPGRRSTTWPGGSTRRRARRWS